MKPVHSAVAEVESTFAGEDIQMGFDPKSLQFAMDILSDIYSNPTMAVVREYIVNAIDSHVEAGNTDPVQVTLPNAFSPNLIIQDFGVGMSRTDVRDVYSQYVASTKRLSDDVSGMLGIGAKSAFSYSNGFLVTAVKGGKRIHVSVNRSEVGGGVMTVLNETDTTDGNGVTISIPVRDAYEMERAVRKFCAFLEPGKVLVDGQDLSERDQWELVTSDVTDDDGNVIIERLWRVPNASSSKVIMGNVPYDPMNGISPTHGVSIYAQVPMGSVVFEPSREGLKDAPITRKTEEAIKQAYVDFLTEQISQEIATAPDKIAARKAMKDMLDKMQEVGITTLKYNGEDVPSIQSLAIDIDQKDPSIDLGNISASYGHFSPRREINYRDIDNIKLVVTGAPKHTRPGPVFRQRIANYLKRVHDVNDAYYGYNGVLFLSKEQEGYIKGDWYDLSPIVVDWSVLKKEHVDRTRIGGGGVKTAGKHFVIDKNGTGVLQEVDDDEEILYVVGTKVREDWNLERYTYQPRPRYLAPYDRSTYRAFMALVRKVVDDDILIIDVYANRLDKFRRDHPNASELTLDSVSAKIEAYLIEQVTDGDILSSIYMYNAVSSNLLDLMPEDDEDAKTLLALGTGSRDALRRVEIAKSLGNKDFNEHFEKIVESANEARLNLYTRYPILPALRDYIRDDKAAEAIKGHLLAVFLESKEDNDDSV